MEVDASSPTSLDAPSSAPLTRADGLWFEDCGLIIQAESTVFRVSRDYLALQSTVFRDMLSMPQPKDADMMDGCPVVVLPDSADDVTFLLKALLYCDFFEPYPAPTTHLILMGILQMSHKYGVEALRKRSLTHLSSIHPTTLSEYEATRTFVLEQVRDDSFNLVRTLLLGRKFSIDWILPVTFYRVCEFTAERDILQGSLNMSDKIWLMTVSRVLEGAAVTTILEFLWPSGQSGDCTTPKRCAKSRFEQRRNADGWRVRASEQAAVMPLEIWEPPQWDRLKVCDVCMTSMKADHQAAKQALWDELPGMFGLPEWSELEKLKTEALK
ncbi:hypothetical protein C8R47DRAFT_1295900 [Mycena vitilis]|nr:hypothetical protein C8R47DRAFT_1295900 [Mycena vitilis]